MKIQLILKGEKDIYRNYEEAFFKQSFEKNFKPVDKKNIPGSLRNSYLFRRYER